MDGTYSSETPKNVTPIRPDVVVDAPTPPDTERSVLRDVLDNADQALFTRPSHPVEERVHAEQVRTNIRAHAEVDSSQDPVSSQEQGFARLRNEFESRKTVRGEEVERLNAKIVKKANQSMPRQILGFFTDGENAEKLKKAAEEEIAEWDSRLNMVENRDVDGAIRYLEEIIRSTIPLAHGKSMLAGDGESRREYRAIAADRIGTLSKFDKELAQRYMDKLDSSSGNRLVDLGLA